MKKKIDAVIYDGDGPLLDTWPVMVESANAAIEKHGGKSRTAEEHYESMEVPFEAYWRKIAPGISVELLEAEFKTHFEHRPVARAPGAHETVLELARHEYLQVVLSATSQARLDREMHRHGFAAHFFELLGGHKHKTQALFSFCVKHGLQPERVVFVEDSWSGVNHGNEAGVVTVGLALYGREDVIRRGNPKHVIKHMSELPALLHVLNGHTRP